MADKITNETLYQLGLLLLPEDAHAVIHGQLTAVEIKNACSKAIRRLAEIIALFEEATLQLGMDESTAEVQTDGLAMLNRNKELLEQTLYNVIEPLANEEAQGRSE